MRLESALQRIWYGSALRSLPLWPLEAVYRALMALRTTAYRHGWLPSLGAGVPVVVVGNLTVGGTGKTPIAAWLAAQLQARGRRVGIVLRGHGGRHTGPPRVVNPGDDPQVVGDEAALHARRGAHVVVIGADRVAAARLAAAQGAQTIVCDDGLQHLRLARDLDIVVVDARRGFGNGHLLPAGPLRESPRRLERAAALVWTRRDAASAAGVQRPALPRLQLEATLRLGEAVNLLDGARRTLAQFRDLPVFALAGVGNPAAFFAALRESGLEAEGRALPDHARIEPRDFDDAGARPVLMTEKDAVKCLSFAAANWWYVEFVVEVEPAQAERLLQLVPERSASTTGGIHG